ncbi:hypothetical protein ACEQ8H_001587 [Pleosporales sp. CAS-2024a]
MATFILDEAEGFGDSVEVTLTENITKEQLLSFAAFKDWKAALRENLDLQATDKDHAFHDSPYCLHSITIQSVDWFQRGNIGFVKLRAKIQNSEGASLPGVALLRGGSVAVLMILRPHGTKYERYVVMTEQARIPIGSLQFLEIPAGMLDGKTHFSGKAADEIEEETKMRIPKEELIDMTELALRGSQVRDKRLRNAMYPSPGGSDEFISIFLWEKELDRQIIEDLKGRLAGEKSQGEMITVRVLKFEDLWKEGARDAKTLAAWALYESLSRAGILQAELQRRKGKGNDKIQ